MLNSLHLFEVTSHYFLITKVYLTTKDSFYDQVSFWPMFCIRQVSVYIYICTYVHAYTHISQQNVMIYAVKSICQITENSSNMHFNTTC
jgi:hypothetical protein